MFFLEAIIAFAFAASALAVSVPRADNGTDALTERASHPWLSGTQSGSGTWFQPGLGACGLENSASDLIVAVSTEIYDNYPGYTGGNPNKDPVCKKGITAKYKGHSVSVSVVDRCVGCATTDLDLSPAAFERLAPLSAGRIPITWNWN